jgi:hypothetical protein
VIWPLQVDVFIAVGELALFVALADRWRVRSRTAAWAVTLAGLAVSVAGNVGHVAGHSLASRATAADPPLAAASARAVGLGVLKGVVARQSAAPSAAASAVPAEVASARPERRAESGIRRTRQSPQRRRKPQRVRRSVMEWDAAALPVLATGPQMSTAELARRFRTSERNAGRSRPRWLPRTTDRRHDQAPAVLGTARAGRLLVGLGVLGAEQRRPARAQGRQRPGPDHSAPIEERGAYTDVPRRMLVPPASS